MCSIFHLDPRASFEFQRISVVRAAPSEALVEAMRPLARDVEAVPPVDTAENAAERIGELTAGRGADVVVEASGSPAAIASSVGMIRRLGRIVVIGMTGREQISFPWDAAIWKMCTIVFNQSTGYSSWEKAIGLIAGGKIDAAHLITHRVPLAEWQGAFAAAEKGAALKALLVP